MDTCPKCKSDLDEPRVVKKEGKYLGQYMVKCTNQDCKYMNFTRTLPVKKRRLDDSVNYGEQSSSFDFGYGDTDHQQQRTQSTQTNNNSNNNLANPCCKDLCLHLIADKVTANEARLAHIESNDEKIREALDILRKIYSLLCDKEISA